MANLIIQQTIPIVFKKILKDRVSGQLIVRGITFEKNLFFIEGSLVHATTTAPEERLGQILYRSGKIDAALLEKLPELLKNQKEKVGKILVRHNIVTHRDVFEALSRQFSRIAISLFSISHGEWDFLSKLPKLPADSRFTIKLPGIIKNGMRITGHIAFFENEFFYQKPKTGIIPQSVSKYLSSEEINFYKQLSNFNNLQVGKIIKTLNISEETFWKKINLFYLLNILDFDETTGSLEDTAVAIDKKVIEIIGEVMGLYDAIRSNKIDYYGLLKVMKDVTSEQLKTSFTIVSERYNPVSLNVPEEISEKIKFVYSEIKQAYETLSNKDRKREYDWENFEKRVADVTEDEEENDKDDIALDPDEACREAKKCFATAEGLYKERKYLEAAVLLEKVVEMDKSNPSYFFLLGLAQSEVPLLRRKAERTLHSVVEMDPQDAEPLYALGLLYRAEDMPKKAEVYFRKALEVNVDHTLAGKMLNQMEVKEKDEPVKKKSFFTIFGKK